MSSQTQQALELEMDRAIQKCSNRFCETRLSGLKLWTNLIDDIHADSKAKRIAKDKEIHGHATQLETLVNQMDSSAAKAQLLDKVYKIKSLVGLICLGIVCFTVGKSVFCARAVRRNDSQVSSIHRVVRRREAVSC